MSLVKTPEDEFVHELEGYLDIKFDKYSLTKITGLLSNYRNSLPDSEPIVIKAEKIVYREFKTREQIPPMPEYKTISPMEIINKVLDATGLTMKELTGKERYQRIIVGRHVAMYVIRDVCGLTVVNIGKLFNRDHTTVIHGISNVMSMIETGSEAHIKLIGYINYHLSLPDKKTA
jgi:chromosomal replication initiation ATPase DnaA